MSISGIRICIDRETNLLCVLLFQQRSDLRMWDQMISALPDVTRTELVPGADEFVVIACDGIWNAMTSQAVVDFVYDRLHPDTAGAQEVKRSREEVSSEEKKEKEESEEEENKGVDRHSPEFLAKICEEVGYPILIPFHIRLTIGLV